jgi:hypothetical protein
LVTDGCINTIGQVCNTKGGKKKLKCQKFKYRNPENVEYEMLCYTCHQWGHRNLSKKQKKKWKK